jgi:PAS domain S-box-containing protein
MLTVAVTTTTSYLVVETTNATTSLIFAGGVAFIGWYMGPRWAIAVALLTAVAAIFFVLPPRLEAGIERTEDATLIALFLLVAAMIAGLAWFRERAEANRAISEERLQLALEAGDMGSWQWNIATNEVVWSRELERLHGLEPGSFPGNFGAFLADVHPDDRAYVQEQIGRSLEEGTHHIEYRIVRPDGTQRWVEGRGELHRSADGRPVSMAGICMDISERKEAEEALKESEERFRLVANGAPMLIWVNGLDGCEFVNKAYLDYMGRTMEQTVGMGWAEAVHPEDYESYVGGFAEAFEKRERFEGQVRLRDAGGIYRWFKSVGLPRFAANGTFLGYVGSSADITDVREANDALLASEERMRLASEAAQMGTWEWDIRSGRLVGSAGTARVHGFGTDSLAGDLETYIGIIHRDDRERVASVMLGSLDADAQETEYRIRRPDGALRWVLIKGQLFRDVSGQPSRMLGVCMDITDRKQAESEARENAARITGILDAAVDTIITLDQRGVIASVNPAGCKMFGYEESELVGSEIAMLVPEPFASGQDGFFQHYPATEEKRVLGIGPEVTGRRKDGTLFPADLSVSEIDFAGRRLFTWILRDNTNRRRQVDGQRFLLEAGAALASSLDLETTVTRSVELAVPRLADAAVIDLIGESGAIERAALKHKDPASEEKMRELNRLYPPQAKPGHPIVTSLMEGRTVFMPSVDEDTIKSIAHDERHYQRMRELPTHGGILVPMVAHGRTMGVLSLALDDPARSWDDWDVQVAEGLAQRAAFAIDNARLYARAQEIQEELREANHAKDEFLAMVTHELRTPLTTLTSGAQLLSRKNSLTADTLANILQDMQSEGERMRLIVENLLTLSRVELDRRPVDVEPMLLPLAVEKVTDSQNRMRPSRPVKLRFSPGTPPAAGSPVYTELVVRNLIDNAQKYGGDGDPVEVTVDATGSEIVVSVLDRGPGIQEDEELDMIFERFYRSAKTARRVSGAGMGLAVCRRLVEAQGGRIWAERREGGGLAVSFSLPVYSDGLDSGESNVISSGQVPP